MAIGAKKRAQKKRPTKTGDRSGNGTRGKTKKATGVAADSPAIDAEVMLEGLEAEDGAGNRSCTVAEVLDSVIRSFEALLKDRKVKPTVGDYIRLVQLRRELNRMEDGTKEIKITWVDQKGESSSGE